MLELTKDAVTLYDIEIAEAWQRMSAAEAEGSLICCREAGATVQEYECIDRTGALLRVVLVALNHRDHGAVYVFPLAPGTGQGLLVPEHVDSSDRRYGAYHDAVFADPRVTDLDGAARYIVEVSRDGGGTWEPRPLHGVESVCGGHVQCGAAGALLSGHMVLADGPVRIVSHWDGALERWSPVG